MARWKDPRLITADGEGGGRRISEDYESSQGSKDTFSAQWSQPMGPLGLPSTLTSWQLTPIQLFCQNKGKWPDIGRRIRVTKTQAIWKSPNLSAQWEKLPENKQEMEHRFPTISPPLAPNPRQPKVCWSWWAAAYGSCPSTSLPSSACWNPLISSVKSAAVGVFTPGKLAIATDRTSVFLRASFCQHRDAYYQPLFILYPQIAYLFIHSRNLCLLSPYYVPALGSGKSRPHFICVKTVQRNKPPCPEALSASPLPGTGDAEWKRQTRPLPLGSLHSFHLKIFTYYKILHSFSIFVNDLKACKTAHQSFDQLKEAMRSQWTNVLSPKAKIFYMTLGGGDVLLQVRFPFIWLVIKKVS